MCTDKYMHIKQKRLYRILKDTLDGVIIRKVVQHILRRIIYNFSDLLKKYRN